LSVQEAVPTKIDMPVSIENRGDHSATGYA